MGRRLKLGMIGGGQGAFIGAVHRLCARMDDKYEFVAGGVIPGYSNYLHDMSADEYIEKVKAGELYDPTLSFQLQNGFEARGAIPDYLDDPSVGNNAVLIVWENPDY